MCNTCEIPVNIQSLSSNNKIPVDKRGFVYYYVNNISNDISKKDTITQIDKSFGKRNSILFGMKIKVKFIKTFNKKKSYINIFFRNPGDLDIPQAFEQQTLAYAYAPYGGEHQGKIYFNDSYDRDVVSDGNKESIIKVLVHEIGHTLNLGHSTDVVDIMYKDNIEGDSIIITKDTKRLLDQLYL